MATKTMDLGQVMGTSAYQEAQAGGYTGTKEEFQKELAAVGNGGETFVIQANANVSTSGITISNVDKTLDEVNAARQEGKAIRLKLIIDSGAYQEFPLLGFFQISEKFIYGFGGADALNAAAVELTFEGDSVSAVAVDKKLFSLSDNDPAAPGTASAGTSDAAARADHVHPKEVSDADRATWNGSVRYDAAQSLTDTQKAQARTNINAAPGGFGLGGMSKQLGPIDNLDTLMDNGWYYYDESSPPQGTLPTTLSSQAHCIRVTNEGGACCQEAIDVSDSQRSGCVLRRIIYGTTAYPWEFVTPPMETGQEYRTTERFWGRPVYYKIVDCGKIADNKQVEHGIVNMRDCISFQGLRGGMPMPSISNNNLAAPWSCYVADVSRTKITLACGASAVGGNCHVMLKYTKTTD